MRKRIDILRGTCARHGVTVAMVRSHRRMEIADSKIQAAKIEAIKTMRLAGYSLPLIGDVMDRHHTSIIHQIRKHGTDQ